jgi:thiol:disulfide interchange protein DsbD
MAFLPLLISLLAVPLQGQKLDPIKWKLEIDPATARPGSRILARLTAEIEPGWHLYSMTTPPPPRATRISLVDYPDAVVHVQAPKVAYDPNFQTNTETYEDRAVFLIEAQLQNVKPGELTLAAEARYQACDATRCLPPVKRMAEAVVKVAAGARESAIAIPAGFTRFDPASVPKKAVVTPQKPAPAAAQEDALSIIPVAFGFGLLAIFTPCVFPMIPLVMSQFLGRESASRGQVIGQAALFCGGIIVLFSVIGLAVTAALGPFGVVQLASNPWVNGFIAVIFFVFALSLLGAFELTLPSGLLTRVNQASERGGFIGTLLMGLAFSLTSFACVGPFVGPLLAASAQSGGMRPVTGMVSFAAGLSAPFFLLAVFPSYLKRIPRSGGWLPRVKIVMGFVLLAVMLKYLSSVDQVLQWNYLTRERFLATWMVLFAMPGLYLLGFLRMEGISKDEPVGLGRLFSGMGFLIFSASLVPGVFGQPLGEVDAYVPLPSKSGFAAASGGRGVEFSKNNLPEALAKARAEGKLVFVNFTGFACTNCHWMKANMFTRPEVAEAMNRFVLVELYTDGTDSVSEENQRLQESTFQTISIPYYAIFDADQKVVATFPGLTRNPEEFLKFLNDAAASKTAAL